MKNPSQSTAYVVTEPPEETFSGGNIDPRVPPRVSVCIPTKNRESSLRECLQSIAAQDYPDIEIVVVDNGSVDASPAVARQFTDRVFFCDGPLGKVRQFSIDASTGPIVALLDDDVTLPHSQWLSHAVKYFNYSDRVGTVWPRNAPPPHAPPFTRLYLNFWKVTMEDRVAKGRGLCGGGNALFLRSALEEVGGVNRSVHWGEDFDWAGKLRSKGYQVVYVKDPLWHDTMRSLREFTRKQFIGAATFATSHGFRLMQLSLRDVFHEQVVLGTKGMVLGLLKERDMSWLLYPAFIGARVFAFATTGLWLRLGQLLQRRRPTAPPAGSHNESDEVRHRAPREDYRALTQQHLNPKSEASRKLRVVDAYINPADTLLDIGTGTGELLALEKHKFARLYGVELDTEAIDLCRARFRNEETVTLVKADVGDMLKHFRPGQFDVIAALDILEHLDAEKCETTLETIASLARDGGRFIFTGPGIFQKVRIALRRSPTHLHSHSSFGWRRLISEHGFRVHSVETTGFPLVNSSFLRRRLHLFGQSCVVVSEKAQPGGQNT